MSGLDNNEEVEWDASLCENNKDITDSGNIKDETKNEEDVIKEEGNIKFDDYVRSRRDDMKELKEREMSGVTINNFPTSLNTVFHDISEYLDMRMFFIQNLAVVYGLEKIKNEEIRSFGLLKKIDVVKRLSKFVPVPSSSSNDLKVISDECHICKKTLRLSDQGKYLLSEIKFLLNIGSSDLALLCIMISFGDSDFVDKNVIWFKNEYKLKREKKGLKIFKIISHIYRERIRSYLRELDMVRADYIVRQQENNHWTQKDVSDLKEIVDLREEVLHMRLDREFSGE